MQLLELLGMAPATSFAQRMDWWCIQWQAFVIGMPPGPGGDFLEKVTMQCLSYSGAARGVEYPMMLLATVDGHARPSSTSTFHKVSTQDA